MNCKRTIDDYFSPGHRRVSWHRRAMYIVYVHTKIERTYLITIGIIRDDRIILHRCTACLDFPKWIRYTTRNIFMLCETRGHDIIMYDDGGKVSVIILFVSSSRAVVLLPLCRTRSSVHLHFWMNFRTNPISGTCVLCDLYSRVIIIERIKFPILRSYPGVKYSQNIVCIWNTYTNITSILTIKILK